MNPFSSNLLRVAALAIALPVIGMCSNVQINGICVNAVNCITPTPVTFGNTLSGSTANGVTLNTDPFSVTTTYSVGYNNIGTFVIFNPRVTYIGAAPSVGTETVTVDLFASVFDNSPGSFDGTYNEHIPLIITDHSTASGELFVDGQGVGLVGVFGPGYYNVSKSAFLTGLTGDTLNYDFHFVFNFTPGVAPGGYDASEAVPEPALIVPAGLSLVGFSLVALRRRKQ